MLHYEARKTLSREAARDICERALSGAETRAVIAADYGVSADTVSQIRRGNSHGGYTADIRNVVTSRLR